MAPCSRTAFRPDYLACDVVRHRVHRIVLTGAAVVFRGEIESEQERLRTAVGRLAAAVRGRLNYRKKWTTERTALRLEADE